jgi:hypothetical protein
MRVPTFTIVINNGGIGGGLMGHAPPRWLATRGGPTRGQF